LIVAVQNGVDRRQLGPGSVEPWVVANALIGVHRALVQYSRTEVLAGTRNPTLVRRVRAQGKVALAALDQGLGDYGIKQD
jgi:hypothetical protein